MPWRGYRHRRRSYHRRTARSKENQETLLRSNLFNHSAFFLNLPAANLPSGGTPITLYTPAVNYFAISDAIAYFLGFNLNQFPDAAMYTTIYDLYRIIKVEVEFRPNVSLNNITNTSTMGTTYQAAVGKVPWYCWVDLAATSTNVDVSTFKSVDNLHSWNYDEVYKLHFWPKPDTTLINTSGTGQAGAGPLQAANWIDTAYPTIQHSGLLVFTGGTTAGSIPKLATDNSVVNMWVRMFVEFKFNE